MSEMAQQVKGNGGTGATEAESPLNPDIEKMKDVAEIAAVKGQVVAINGEVAALKQQIDVRAGELQKAQESLQAKINDVSAKQKELEGLQTTLEDLAQTSKASHDSVKADIQAISDFKANFETLKNDATARSGELQAQHDALKGKMGAVETQQTAIDTFFKSLLQDEKDTETGKVLKFSTKSSIDNFFTQIKEQLTTIEKRRGEIEKEVAALKEALELKINSLLPNAGAAGLGYAFFDAKSRYGSVAFRPPADESPKLRNKLTARIGHFVRNNTSIVFYHLLFLVPLLFITDLFIGLYLGKHFLIEWAMGDSGSGQLSNGNLTNEKTQNFFYITIPLAIISWFGFSSIRQNRRLYGEYDYKQRVMQLYRSFKEEIEKEGKPEQKQKLLDIMLTTVESKPSLKGEPHLMEMIVTTLFGRKAVEDKTES